MKEDNISPPFSSPSEVPQPFIEEMLPDPTMPVQELHRATLAMEEWVSRLFFLIKGSYRLWVVPGSMLYLDQCNSRSDHSSLDLLELP